MKTKILSILSIIFFIGTIILIYFSFINFNEISYDFFTLSRKNKDLKDELNLVKNNILKENENLENQNGKIIAIEEEIKKFNTILNNKNLQNIEDELKSLSMDYVNSNLDFSIMPINNKKSLKPLESVFLEEANDFETARDNLTLLPFFVNSYAQNVLNYSIAKNNANIFESLGLTEYIKKGDNFLIKSILLKHPSKMEKLKDLSYETAAYKNNYYNYYENIFNFSKYSKSYLQNLRTEMNSRIEKYPNILNVDLNKLDNMRRREVFSIEIINSSVNYLENFNIIEKDNTRNLVDKHENILMNEERSDNKNKINYFNLFRQEIYTSSDLK